MRNPILLLAFALPAGCIVQESEPECEVAADCGEVGVACVEGACVADCAPQGTVTCAADQVEVCGAWCMDAWEASRPDATAENGGTDSSLATSRAGVIPWYSSDAVAGMNPAIATAACEAAGRRLCRAAEWKIACAGTDGLAYAYGDEYDPVVCNGIDTYCTCDGEDPYPHCYDDCDSDAHVMPTGAFPECVSPWGAWDASGNVWEVVASGDGHDHYRGGAYNCIDSEQNHRCGYDATWNPSAKGFRCCSDGVLR